MPNRFSWVVDNVIAGSERPGLFHDLEHDLEFYRNNGVGAIVNLEERFHFREYEGFVVKHIPINDFGPPALGDFEEFLSFIYEQVANNNGVVVHCYAGMGRTNVMIASYLIHHLKVDPRTALETVKSRRPMHYVNEEQEDALLNYYYVIRDEL